MKSKALTLLLPETKPEQIETLLTGFASLENVHQRLLIVTRAAQGACLLKLREAHGHLKGGGVTSARCGGASWEDYIKGKWGFTDDTARRRMQVWSGMQPRLEKLSPAERERFGEFMRRPMLHLTEPEVKVLEKITSKLTDAETEKEFLLECGFLKKPHGHGLLKDHDKSKSDDTTAEATPELLIQDELFGRFNGVDEIVKAWNTPTKVGKEKAVALWEHMTKAQKQDALSKIETSITKFTDMRDQLKEALGKK